jgi:acetyltransferase-like isoleucine patch superfamily enzyme
LKHALVGRGLARTITPGAVATLYYFARFRAKISPRAEVDITSNISFGAGCIIGSFTKVKASEGRLSFGSRGGIATNCFVSTGSAGIVIGDNFICGPNVNIIGQNYRHDYLDQHLEDQGIVSTGIEIGNNVWIGAGCTITDGSRIGNNTLVVANSLVNGRYPDGVILQGSPARVVFRR